jgi:hypothetical protein
MTEDEQVEVAFRRLPVVPADDHESVERGLRQSLRRGISLDDAIKLEYYSEEVSPHFEEEWALARMSEIYAKYPHLKKGEPI